MIKILVPIAVLAVLFGVFVLFEQQTEDAPRGDSSELSDTTNPEPSDVVDTKDDTDLSDVTVSTGPILDLSNKGLTRAPDYIFTNDSIEQLDLSNNKLGGSLQAEVRLLQNLRVLDLSNNTFTGVPAEIGQLKNLEVLDLSNNQITGLPHELGNLPKLKLLNLEGNAYSEADLAIIKNQLSDSVEIRVD